MAKATRSTQIRDSVIFRNILLATGALIFPALLALLIKFPNHPESQAVVVLGIPILGGLLAIICAAGMQFHLRKLARGEHQTFETE